MESLRILKFGMEEDEQIRSFLVKVFRSFLFFLVFVFGVILYKTTKHVLVLVPFSSLLLGFLSSRLTMPWLV